MHKNRSMKVVLHIRTLIMFRLSVLDSGVACCCICRLHEAGAAKVYAICTHGILSGNAITNINNSQFECVVVTDTIPQENSMRLSSKLQVTYRFEFDIF